MGACHHRYARQPALPGRLAHPSTAVRVPSSCATATLTPPSEGRGSSVHQGQISRVIAGYAGTQAGPVPGMGAQVAAQRIEQSRGHERDRDDRDLAHHIERTVGMGLAKA